MRYLKRRLISLSSHATELTEEELYEGHDIQFLLIDTTGATPVTLTFSIEINGVQVYNGSLAELRDENALIYGFDDTTQNENVGILDLNEMLSGNGGRNSSIHSVNMKIVAGGANNFNVTVGEIIDIT